MTKPQLTYSIASTRVNKQRREIRRLRRALREIKRRTQDCWCGGYAPVCIRCIATRALKGKK